jgi:hypothetical protein
MIAKLVEDYLKQHFQIYKNNDKSDFYNYIVLKGNDLYSVRIEPGHSLQWKYVTQIYKPTYSINGTLINKPSKEMIYILQNTLKPISAVRDNVNEIQNFTRGLDPKEAMKIGIIAKIKEEYNYIKNKTPYQIYLAYYAKLKINADEISPGVIGAFYFNIIKNIIIYGSNYQKIFNKEIKNFKRALYYVKNREDINKIINQTIQIIKNKFDIKLNITNEST